VRLTDSTAPLTPQVIAKALAAASAGLPVELAMISNRGTKVWPGPLPATMRVDHWRCRFRGKAGSNPGDFAQINHGDITKLLDAVAGSGLDFIKIETLCDFDGKAGFSKGQGE
jgi:isocitrate dehydrogenase